MRSSNRPSWRSKASTRSSNSARASAGVAYQLNDGALSGWASVRRPCSPSTPPMHGRPRRVDAEDATAARAPEDELAVLVDTEPVPAPLAHLAPQRGGVAAELDVAIDGLHAPQRR